MKVGAFLIHLCHSCTGNNRTIRADVIPEQQLPPPLLKWLIPALREGWHLNRKHTCTQAKKVRWMGYTECLPGKKPTLSQHAPCKSPVESRLEWQGERTLSHLPSSWGGTCCFAWNFWQRKWDFSCGHNCLVTLIKQTEVPASEKVNSQCNVWSAQQKRIRLCGLCRGLDWMI